MSLRALVISLALVLLPGMSMSESTTTMIKTWGEPSIADQNVLAAIEFLETHGDAGIAAKVRAHINKGFLLWTDTGGDAYTSAVGIITLPSHRVGMGAGRKQVFDPVENYGQIFTLAITLVHELVHAEQHGGQGHKCMERLASNTWGGIADYKPHEIEGWTKGLQAGLRWLRFALSKYSKVADGPQRLQATRQLALAVSNFKTLIGDFESHKFYGSRQGAKWLALNADLLALEKDLQADLSEASRKVQRNRCLDKCGMLARLAHEKRIRVGEAEDQLAAAHTRLKSAQNRHATLDEEITKHKEQIERSHRQLSRENVGERTQKLLDELARKAQIGIADAKRKKAKLPPLADAQSDVDAAQQKLDNAVAAHQAARQKWLACMALCLNDLMFQPDGTRTEFPEDALPSGFGLSGGKVVYDPEFRRERRHRFSFDMLKWKTKLDSRAGKLPTGIEGDEVPCPETTAETGIRLHVYDVFGENGFQQKPTEGVTISVTDGESVQKARVVTGSIEEHELIVLEPGTYTLTLDIGRYLSAIPESCNDGYQREFTIKKGEQLEFSANVYSTNVAKSGQSVAPGRGDCIRSVPPND